MTLNDPTGIPSLLAALRAGDCLADPAGPQSIEVRPRWLVDADDAAQALIELGFFARAWEAANPGVILSLSAAVP